MPTPTGNPAYDSDVMQAEGAYQQALAVAGSQLDATLAALQFYRTLLQSAATNAIDTGQILEALRELPRLKLVPPPVEAPDEVLLHLRRPINRARRRWRPQPRKLLPLPTVRPASFVAPQRKRTMRIKRTVILLQWQVI
jgi:multidrug efflux pump subunit AcrA (membrane-fusion protein)